MIYDLKGSLVGRFRERANQMSKLTALLDRNFLIERKLKNNLIKIPDDKCEHFLHLLQNDVYMLRENNLMDYSLLFIILEVPPPESKNYQKLFDCFTQPGFSERLIQSTDGKFLYCFGLIDYLQAFNVKKLFENKFKGLVYGKEKEFISAVDPVLYSDRMLNFMRDNLFTSRVKIN